MSATSFSLWIRAETEVAAAEQGKAWADAEPQWTFVRVVSVSPREHYHVWTVVVDAVPVAASKPAIGFDWFGE